MLPLVFSFLFVLAIVAVVGHGIWVLVATLFSSGTPKKPSAAQITHCPRCDSQLSPSRTCRVCQWPLQRLTRNGSPASLWKVQQQLDRFHTLGLLDTAAYNRLIAAVRSELQAAEISAGMAVPVAAAPDPGQSTSVPLDCGLPPEAEEIVVVEAVDEPQPPQRPQDVSLAAASRVQEFFEKQAQQGKAYGLFDAAQPTNGATAADIPSGSSMPRAASVAARRRAGRGPISWPRSWKTRTFAGANSSADC